MLLLFPLQNGTESYPPLVVNCIPIAHCSPWKPNEHLPSQAMTSSSWCKTLKEAILRHSEDLHCTEPTENPSLWSSVAALLQGSFPLLYNVDSDKALSSHDNQHPPSHRPLFAPPTLLVGDSIIRHTHFFNVTSSNIPISRGLYASEE